MVLDTAGDWRASFTVNNLFDWDPAIGGTSVAGDEIGRRYTLGFQQNF